MSTIILTDWTDPSGRIVGCTVFQQFEDGAVPHLCRDVTFSDSYASIVAAWVDPAEAVDDRRTATQPRPIADFTREVGADAYWRLVRGTEIKAEAPILASNEALMADARTTAAALPGYRFEIVQLHDGPEVQHLVPGVAATPHQSRLIARELQRRTARRGDAPLPSGGLFDDVARAQQDLFA